MKISPDIYFSDNYLVLDFEIDTSYGDYGHPVHPENQMLLACWKSPQTPDGEEGEVQSQWGDQYALDRLLIAIENADFIVAHNAKYELGWLYRCGLDLSSLVVFDTKIAEYVLLGNLAAGDEMMAPRSTSLSACIARRGWEQKDPVVDKLMSNGINPVEMPRPWLQGRCEKDVLDTEALFLEQRKALFNTNRLGVLYTRCFITPMLAQMEFTGMTLDAERVEKEYTKAIQRRNELSQELDDFTGGLNWNSPIQLAEYLYDELEFKELRKFNGEPKRTKTGRRKVDSKTLDKLKATNKKQKEFIKLRKEIGKVQAALSKSLEFFKGVCAERNCNFNAVFNQTTTATHRLSSSGMPQSFECIVNARGQHQKKSAQFQNLPNSFKPCFTSSKDDWVFAEADGSQLEFRVAAQLSGDEQMVSDIMDPNFDAHILSASEMREIPYKDLLDRYRDGETAAYKIRRECKPYTFGPLYGKSSGSPAEMRWINAFRERYSAFYEYSAGNAHKALSTKRMVTPWGLRFYWPYARISSSGYINVNNAVYNYPVQSFATAEIIPIAIGMFWREALAYQGNIRPINTVHDSLLCEVQEDFIDYWKEIAIRTFTTDVYTYLEEVYGYELDLVPLGVGLSWGSHWADDSNSEEEWNVFTNGERQRII